MNEEEIEKIITRQPNHLEQFLHTYAAKEGVRILDLGCGNNSIQRVREFGGNNVYYSGLDVGDYNLPTGSKDLMNEYLVVKSSEFAKTILKWENKQDVVVSNHNLEHCDEPDAVIINAIKALKKGGHLYLAFPSEESASFPKGFKGCLNFYDDCTHQIIPEWNKILDTLKNNGIKIMYKSKNYQPEAMKEIGLLNWPYSSELKVVLPGIWELFGFESIIWGEKE